MQWDRLEERIVLLFLGELVVYACREQSGMISKEIILNVRRLISADKWVIVSTNRLLLLLLLPLLLCNDDNDDGDDKDEDGDDNQRGKTFLRGNVVLSCLLSFG